MTITQVILLVIGLVYFSTRLIAYDILQRTLEECEKLAYEMKEHIQKERSSHGLSYVLLENPKSKSMNAKAQKLYQRAIYLTAFLMYWPIGPLFYQRSMLKSTNWNNPNVEAHKIGACIASNDVISGNPKKTKSFHWQLLLGMTAALKKARPLI